MDVRKQLNLDLLEVRRCFPKLRFFTKGGDHFLKGDLDICDIVGEYWDTFEIGITIPKNYPNGVPLVFEISRKIPREDKRHISKEGVCCVDIDHELLYLARRGLKLVNFIRDKVYPYFANQLYYMKNGCFAKGEFKHRLDGILQFYDERLNISDTEVAIRFLERLVINKLPGRNDPCLCNSGKKYKYCHETSMAFLKSIGTDKVKSDLAQFKEIISN